MLVSEITQSTAHDWNVVHGYENLKKIGNYYQSQRVTFLEERIEVNMDKIVITIFQGSVVTQTVLGGLTMHHPVANFL